MEVEDGVADMKDGGRVEGRWSEGGRIMEVEDGMADMKDGGKVEGRWREGGGKMEGGRMG